MKHQVFTHIFFAVVLMVILTSCTEQDLSKGTLSGQTIPPAVTNHYAALMEQARWGDGDAYLQLAELYHTGNGTGQDFLNSLSMLTMAEQYGGISSVEDYMKALPSEDNYKMFYDAVECLERKNNRNAFEMSDKIISSGFVEGYTLKGIISVEKGDTLEGKRFLSHAAEQGSSFAELLLATLSDWHGATMPDVERLTPLADRIPFACMLLGDAYAGDDKGIADEELAAMFYQKADEHGVLNKQAARWLLAYYTRNHIPVGERELERLSILSADTDCSCEEDTTAVQSYDTLLEDSIETTR